MSDRRSKVTAVIGLVMLIGACGAGPGEEGAADAGVMDGGAMDAARIDAAASSMDGAPATVSLSRDVQPILSASCANGYCHPGSYSPMSLTPGVAFSTLVDVRSSCADGRKRVAPGDADPRRSYVMAKLLGVELCGDTGRMPPSGAMLPADQIELVRAWIAAGAKDD